MKTIIKEKTIEHPLEEIFDIEENTTIVEYKEILPTELVVAPTYDTKDQEVEQQLQSIYDAAMGNTEIISDEIERVEGKYKARIIETTAAMLNVALGAVREKSLLKQHKDKIYVNAVGAGTPNTINNNLIMDRNEVIKMLLKQKIEK